MKPIRLLALLALLALASLASAPAPAILLAKGTANRFALQQGPLAGCALGMDFTRGGYRSTQGFVIDPALLPTYTYARAGAKAEYWNGQVYQFASGVPAIVPGVGYFARPAQTNLLLNAGTNTVLASQGVTVTNGAHTFAFIGTGSVTFSGKATATLAGTGATDRVSITVTTSGGSGTLGVTVSGDVRYATLIDGTYAGSIIATAGAQVTVAADDMRMTSPIPADEDWLMLTAATLPEATGTPGRRFLAFSDGTSSNQAFPQMASASGVVQGSSASGGVVTQPVAGTQTTAGRILIGYRRMGGAFSILSKTSDGTQTISAEIAGAMPIGMNRIDIGNGRSSFYANAPVEYACYRRGTYPDAALTAMMAAL